MHAEGVAEKFLLTRAEFVRVVFGDDPGLCPIDDFGHQDCVCNGKLRPAGDVFFR